MLSPEPAVRALVSLNRSFPALRPSHTVWHSWKSGLSQSESAHSQLRKHPDIWCALTADQIN